MKYLGKVISKEKFIETISSRLKPIERYQKIYEEHLLKVELERLKIKNKASNLEDAVAIVEKIKGGLVIRYVWIKAYKDHSVCREVLRKILSFDEKDFLITYNNRYYVTARGFYYGDRPGEWKFKQRFSYYDYSHIGFSELKIDHKIEPLKYCARYFEWRFKNCDSYSIERIILQLINEPRYEIAYKNEYFERIFDIEKYSNKQLYFATKNKVIDALPFIKDFNCYDLALIKSIDNISELACMANKLESEGIDKFRFIRFLRNYIAKNEIFKASDYLDFLRNLIDLKLNFKEWVFDKDFIEDHFHFVNQITELENEEKIKKWDSSYKKTAKKYKELYLSNEQYLVRVPKDIRDFINEANQQHNCLFANGYYKKMTKGECIILFVRMAEDPDKPYATIELDPNGRIIQARLQYNAEAPSYIRDLVNETYCNYRRTALGGIA